MRVSGFLGECHALHVYRHHHQHNCHHQHQCHKQHQPSNVMMFIIIRNVTHCVFVLTIINTIVILVIKIMAMMMVMKKWWLWWQWWWWWWVLWHTSRCSIRACFANQNCTNTCFSDQTIVGATIYNENCTNTCFFSNQNSTNTFWSHNYLCNNLNCANTWKLYEHLYSFLLSTNVRTLFLATLVVVATLVVALHFTPVSQSLGG